MKRSTQGKTIPWANAMLEKLAWTDGYDSVEALLADARAKSTVLGICTTCHAMEDVTPDQHEGFCEACGNHTVKSPLVLAECI